MKPLGCIFLPSDTFDAKNNAEKSIMLQESRKKAGSQNMPWYTGMFPLSYPCIVYNLPVLKKPWNIGPDEPGNLPWPDGDPREDPNGENPDD